MIISQKSVRYPENHIGAVVCHAASLPPNRMGAKKQDTDTHYMYILAWDDVKVNRFQKKMMCFFSKKVKNRILHASLLFI